MRVNDDDRIGIVRIHERLQTSAPAMATLILSFEERQKSRQRARLESGEEVGLNLPHGTVLRGGDRLRADDGRVIEVRAAPEPVSTAASVDPIQLARAAYHLGNRHVAVQIGAGWVRYLRDHVLDGMVRALGMTLRQEIIPFEPEAGAYQRHTHTPSAPHSHHG